MDEFARHDTLYLSKIEKDDLNFDIDKPYVILHQVLNKGPSDKKQLISNISKEMFVGYLEGACFGKSIGDPFSNESFDLYIFNGIDYHTRKNIYLGHKLPPIEKNELRNLFKKAGLEKKLGCVRNNG